MVLMARLNLLRDWPLCKCIQTRNMCPCTGPAKSACNLDHVVAIPTDAMEPLQASGGLITRSDYMLNITQRLGRLIT